MTVRRVLVTGASGQLGHAIVEAFAGVDIVAPPHAALDIADPRAVAAAVAAAAPDAVINCAAFNDVDGAQDRPADAFAMNAFAVRSLARAAERAGATLVHYSSDFVFDGLATQPYDEEVSPSPKSVYGASKLVGEWFALEAPRGLVLRVESLFGTPRGWAGRRGSLETIAAGLEEGREVRVFHDRVVSPGYVRDVAAATRHLVEQGSAAGLYHCVNSGWTTWEGIAREVARLMGVEPKLHLVASADVLLKAARPQYSALSTARMAAAGFPMPTWQNALTRWLSDRENRK